MSHPELEPGYDAPTDPAAVEHLLRLVPALAFMPELAQSIPPRPGPADGLTTAVVESGADEDYRAILAAGLAVLQRRAVAQRRGGLAFLAQTMLHFLRAEPIPSSQHPLIVALFLRAEAAAGRLPDDPAELSRALDTFG